MPNTRAFVCPECSKPAQGEVAGKVIWDGYGDEGPEQPPIEWALIQCSRCALALVQVREDYGQGFDGDEPVFVYPQPRRLSFSVPVQLRDDWEEANSCFQIKAYRAAAVMVRRTLEGTCADQGIRERSLAASLKKMQSEGKMDETLAEWSDLLRVVGNEGAHAGVQVSREDAEDAISFSEALLDHIYVLRKRFDEFKARRAAAS